MRIWRDGSNRWTAKLAAWLFLVQALLLAHSMGANAAPVPRDQFGHVICTADADGNHDRSGGPERHPGRLDCCTLGCTMFGGNLAPPPPPASGLAAADRPSIRAVPFALREHVGSGVPASPRRARAPPLPA